ncbi:hypothetical protein V2A60_004312 [Cordyceps javanica]
MKFSLVCLAFAVGASAVDIAGLVKMVTELVAKEGKPVDTRPQPPAIPEAAGRSQSSSSRAPGRTAAPVNNKLPPHH